MVRTSSPGEYSRTSANSIPRPLKTLWYSPAKVSVTRRPVRISMRRTWARISLEITARAPPSGDFDGFEEEADDVLGGEVLGFRLVAHEDAVAEDVGPDGLDVLRSDVAPPVEEG